MVELKLVDSGVLPSNDTNGVSSGRSSPFAFDFALVTCAAGNGEGDGDGEATGKGEGDGDAEDRRRGCLTYWLPQLVLFQLVLFLRAWAWGRMVSL